MENLTQQQIEELIQFIDEAEEPATITNTIIAAVLAFLAVKIAGTATAQALLAEIAARQTADTNLSTSITQLRQLIQSLGSVVYLDSMGEELDGTPVHIDPGMVIYDPDLSTIKKYTAPDDYETIGCNENVLYCNKVTNIFYRWSTRSLNMIQVGAAKIKVINNLTEGGEGDALSAEMGKRLKKLIDNSGASFEVVDNRLCIMATSGASKTPAPTITAEIQTDGRALVTISAADSGTAITYSINGGETQNYSQPFYIDTVGTSTITAKAQADGELPSNTVTATVTTESAGTVTISKGTDDSSVRSVAFTATASDPTATVTIAIGQQTQSGTGTATLSVAKTDELQTVTVMATASKTGKIAATATQQFTVSKLPNTKLQGTSVNPTTGQPELVTDIYIGSKHYTNEASTTDDGMVIDNKTVDGVNVWTLDFEVDNGDGTKTYHDEITTLVRGTNGKAANQSDEMKSANIFGNIDNAENTAQTSKITAITKIPDCVTSFGENSLRWCSKLKSIAVLGSNVKSFGSGASYLCYAEFSVDNDNFTPSSNMPTGLLSFRSNARSSLNFHNQSKVKWIKMPNASGTSSSDVNCGGCTKLCYLEFGNPENESLVSGFSELRYTFIGGTSKPDVIAIHERNPSATKVTDTGASNSFSNGLLFGLINDPTQDTGKPNVRFYVPDDAVDYYKEHQFWRYVSKRILPMSEKPTLEQVLANHIND